MTTSLERVTPVSYRSGMYEVIGSKGDTYIVDRNCTCCGFRYRRQCKHLELVKEYQVANEVELEANLQRRIEDLYG